jgi:hypothetical protein
VKKYIWLRDIHHSPYLVIEGEVQGAMDSSELLDVLGNDFRKIDINNTGDAYALDAKNQVVFSVDGVKCAICCFISETSEESTDYLKLMACVRRELDKHISRLESVLSSRRISLKFRELYLQDPIRYM